MRRLMIAAGLAAMFCIPFIAGARSTDGLHPLKLLIDCARFRGADDEHTLLELYYMLAQRTLTYVPDSAGFTGEAILTCRITEHDSAVVTEKWRVRHSAKDTASLPDRNLVGLQRLELRPGDYVVSVIARDAHDVTRADSSSFKLNVGLFGVDKVVLSDIEFAASIRKGNKEGPFNKNTLDVVPNVGSVYTEAQRCYYYAEVYNLLSGEDRSPYTLKCIVTDALGREVIARETERKRVAESSVFVDNLAMAGLRTGTYTLRLAVVDTASRILSLSGRRFFVYNNKLGVDSTLLAGSRKMPLIDYSAMDVAELDREFKWDIYEATDAERDQYAKLTGAEAKRIFLSEFWGRRPPGFRNEYLSRAHYANQHFRDPGREGYRSDRGRVYITYGAPDDIERFPSESGRKPYEIWEYHQIQGGVLFVFVRINPGSGYQLVHSTARNELHDENWDRLGITQ